MNKKFAAVGLVSLLAIGLTNCTGDHAAAAQLNMTTVESKTISIKEYFITPALHKAMVSKNTIKMDSVIKQLNKHVNKTWYVFGGITPRGWDCSGLVLWTYKHFGIKLRHSATSEKYAAKPHKYSELKAKIGDIIWFPGHVGIYIGNGYMIHAPHPGARTQKVKVARWAKQNGTRWITYTRLIKTN